jgi:hypothetical protein
MFWLITSNQFNYSKNTGFQIVKHSIVRSLSWLTLSLEMSVFKLKCLVLADLLKSTVWLFRRIRLDLFDETYISC